MPTAGETKHERLQVRLNAQTKSLLRRAASYHHKTLSQFVLGTALEEAERIIREHEVVTLSGSDWKAFYDALTNPPPPNAALREAYIRYRKADG